MKIRANSTAGARRTLFPLIGIYAAGLVLLVIAATPGGAKNYPTADVNTSGLAVSDTSVTIGQIRSLTGTMAISEVSVGEAEKLAIEEINASGGVLGRQVQLITEDGASDWPTFAEKAKKLLDNDKVASVMGCWTSASRKAVLPIFERSQGLLYYPTFYEGLEASKNVIYTGQEATQQIIAGIEWAIKTQGKKTFYLLGSDYIWPRTSNKIARKAIEKFGGTVVAEEYTPLGHTQYGSIINKIKLRKPDVIYSIIVGGSNVSWYKQLKAAGVTADKQMLLTISITEDEIRGIGPENVTGFYACMKYFQSLDIPENHKFVSAFKAKYGADRVIGDTMQAGYLGPYLWKLGVEKAGSFDVAKVAAASPGLTFAAPEGEVKVHENHHLWSKTRVGQIQPDGQVKVMWESAMIEPNPWPEGY